MDLSRNMTGPKIVVVGGGGGNAVDDMIAQNLAGVDFLVANTDAQALVKSRAPRIVQLGIDVTQGLGAGSLPLVGRAGAEESIDEIMDHLAGCDMCFLAAGMGGGTGTGAAPIIAAAARAAGILTVAVVTEPFVFDGVASFASGERGNCTASRGCRYRHRRSEPGPVQALQPAYDSCGCLRGS
jgi:cell division protein FtsZ